MKQFSLAKETVPKNWRAIHPDSEITALALSPDGKYLFSTAKDKKFKQWLVKPRLIYNDYGEVFEDDGYAKDMVITPDGLYLFFTMNTGRLKQWAIKGQGLIKQYEDNDINKVAITPDGRF